MEHDGSSTLVTTRLATFQPAMWKKTFLCLNRSLGRLAAKNNNEKKPASEKCFAHRHLCCRVCSELMFLLFQGSEYGSTTDICPPPTPRPSPHYTAQLQESQRLAVIDVFESLQPPEAFFPPHLSSGKQKLIKTAKPELMMTVIYDVL